MKAYIISAPMPMLVSLPRPCPIACPVIGGILV